MLTYLYISFIAIYFGFCIIHTCTFFILQAKKLFERFYANEEFLPRAPDPDEIVDDDKDATAPSADLLAELMSKMQTEQQTENGEGEEMSEPQPPNDDDNTINVAAETE